MKMHILDLGRMYVDEASFVAGIHNGTLRNQNPVAQWIEFPVTGTLVDYGDGYVLFDTGCNMRESVIPDDEDTPSPFVSTEDDILPAQLKKLGIDPSEVKYVVLSHMHCDHVGYLYLFKNAEIIVAEEEFANSMKLYGLRGFGPGPYKNGDFNEFLAAELNWRLLPEDFKEYEIVPGVKAVTFGSGHTYSMTGLFVSLPNSGNFLFSADALYCSLNLGPPVRIPGLIFDSLGYVKSANFIAEYAKKTDAKIIFGHDIKQFLTLKRAPAEYYD
ncbi:MAG: N-acyl homoserine lactonase family protein [Clostridiales Family XIII bacterium]|nr:N-acyl homoserine lactonase family protein [Clostridiales Family XIII bacterium]